MKKYTILFCMLLIAIFLYFNRKWLYVMYKDLLFETHFQFTERWKQNMIIDSPDTIASTSQKVSICFVTLENRGTKEEYVQLHNDSLNAYVQHQNLKNHGHTYTYIFLDHYSHPCNVYWCKYFVVREILESGKYDYVAWLDSDTVIGDPDIDFADVLNTYAKDCYVGTDESVFAHTAASSIINTGVFVFRNSKIGREILKTLCDLYESKEFQDNCLIDNGKKLRGMWGRTCYEQGVLNEILYEKYLKNTAILGQKWIRNSPKCENGFIIHIYGETSYLRTKCFDKYITPKTCWM